MLCSYNSGFVNMVIREFFMKRFAENCLLLVFLIATSIVVQAQGFKAEGNKKTSLSDSSAAQSFTSLEGKFGISLPEVVSAYQPLSLKLPAGTATGQGFVWRMAEGEFTILYLDMPPPPNSPNDPNLLLDGVRETALTQVAAAKGKIIKENSITLSSYPGREFKVELPSGLMTFRVYLVGNRLYQLMLAHAPGQQAQEAVALKALDSFRLLAPADVEAALKKKIADATPAPLPQQPVAGKLKSDAEDDGLKGKVKIVASENEDLSGTWAVAGRKPSSTSYYNEQGNLVKKELYDYRGNPLDITVYGYVDGDRVSSAKSIKHEYNPPPMAAPAGAQSQKRDRRYSSKYKYKYDEKGRLVESESYGNDGRLWMRYVYNFKDNQVEELVYASDGSLNQRYLSTLDEKGNEVERTDFEAGNGSVRNKYSYEYEFDSRGNWVKKTTKRWRTKEGQSSFVPAYVTYRTITYY